MQLGSAEKTRRKQIHEAEQYPSAHGGPVAPDCSHLSAGWSRLKEHSRSSLAQLMRMVPQPPRPRVRDHAMAAARLLEDDVAVRCDGIWDGV